MPVVLQLTIFVMMLENFNLITQLVCKIVWAAQIQQATICWSTRAATTDCSTAHWCPAVAKIVLTYIIQDNEKQQVLTFFSFLAKTVSALLAAGS